MIELGVASASVATAASATFISEKLMFTLSDTAVGLLACRCDQATISEYVMFYLP